MRTMRYPRAGKELMLTATLLVCGAGIALPVRATAAPPAKKASAEAKDPFTKGMEFVGAGKLEEALAQFQQAALAEPNDSIIQSWIGFVHFKRGRYDDAIRHLNKSVQLNNVNPDAYNNLGNAYLAKGEVDAAIENYRKAADLVRTLPEKHWDAFYNLGNALVKKGDLDGALSAFQEAEKLDPNDASIQNNLGYVFEQKSAQDPKKNPIATAIDHYQKAVAKQPNSAVFHRNLGFAARKMEGGSDLAIRSLRRAVQLDTKDYRSHLALAEELQNSKKLLEAIAEYRTAVQMRPAEFVPRYNLGLLLAREARDSTATATRNKYYTEAVQQLDQAQKVRPNDPRVASALGWVHLQLTRYDDAVKWYEKSLAKPTGDADQAKLSASEIAGAHANLGLAYDHLGEVDKAIAHWKEAVKADPSDTLSRAQLASAYSNKHLYAEAAAEYREVVKADPKDAVSFSNLGFVLDKLGKQPEAIDAYKQAIELNPKLAIAYNNLGALYERQGQKDLAKQHYLKASQIDPKLEDAKKNLQRLSGS